MRYLFVFPVSQLIDRQKLFIRVKGKVTVGVVRKIVGACKITYNKQLHEAEQRVGIAVPRIVFIIHNLLHGFPGRYINFSKLDLHHRQSVYKQDDILPLITVFSIYP